MALAYNRFSDAVKAEALKEYLDSLEAYRAEVNVQSESDMRGVVGIPDVSTVLGNMRITIRIGADDVDASVLRELAAWAEARSPVSCTLREGPPVAVEVLVL